MGQLDGKLGAVRHCDTCGKGAYCLRKAARRIARQMHDGHARAYRCPVHPRWWHVGRNPQAVALGLKSAREVYGRPA